MPFKLEPVGLVTRTPSVKRGDFSTNLLNHNSLHVFAGCLQLLKIYWNLKIFVEISWNLIGPAGNFCVRCRRSTALVFSHKNMDKYSSQKYEIYRHHMCSFKFQTHQNPFSARPLWGNL